MNSTLIVVMDKAYFEESYDQSFLYRMRYRKYNPLVGSLFLLASVFLFYRYVALGTDASLYMGIIALLYSAWTFTDNKRAKAKWLRELALVIERQNTLQITFSEAGIDSKTLFAESTIKWSAFAIVQETAKGIFLVPQKGISIYLPKTAFENQQTIQQVLQRFEQSPTTTVQRFVPKKQ
jgi:hypothetical protein